MQPNQDAWDGHRLFTLLLSADSPFTGGVQSNVGLQFDVEANSRYYLDLFLPIFVTPTGLTPVGVCLSLSSPALVGLGFGTSFLATSGHIGGGGPAWADDFNTTPNSPGGNYYGLDNGGFTLEARSYLEIGPAGGTVVLRINPNTHASGIVRAGARLNVQKIG